MASNSDGAASTATWSASRHSAGDASSTTAAESGSAAAATGSRRVAPRSMRHAGSSNSSSNNSSSRRQRRRHQRRQQRRDYGAVGQDTEGMLLASDASDSEFGDPGLEAADVAAVLYPGVAASGDDMAPMSALAALKRQQTREEQREMRARAAAAAYAAKSYTPLLSHLNQTPPPSPRDILSRTQRSTRHNIAWCAFFLVGLAPAALVGALRGSVPVLQAHLPEGLALGAWIGGTQRLAGFVLTIIFVSCLRCVRLPNRVTMTLVLALSLAAAIALASNWPLLAQFPPKAGPGLALWLHGRVAWSALSPVRTAYAMAVAAGEGFGSLVVPTIYLVQILVAGSGPGVSDVRGGGDDQLVRYGTPPFPPALPGQPPHWPAVPWGVEWAGGAVFAGVAVATVLGLLAWCFVACGGNRCLHFLHPTPPYWAQRPSRLADLDNPDDMLALGQTRRPAAPLDAYSSCCRPVNHYRRRRLQRHLAKRRAMAEGHHAKRKSGSLFAADHSPSTRSPGGTRRGGSGYEYRPPPQEHPTFGAASDSEAPARRSRTPPTRIGRLTRQASAAAQPPESLHGQFDSLERNFYGSQALIGSLEPPSPAPSPPPPPSKQKQKQKQKQRTKAAGVSAGHVEELHSSVSFTGSSTTTAAARVRTRSTGGASDVSDTFLRSSQEGVASDGLVGNVMYAAAASSSAAAAAVSPARRAKSAVLPSYKQQAGAGQAGLPLRATTPPPRTASSRVVPKSAPSGPSTRYELGRRASSSAHSDGDRIDLSTSGGMAEWQLPLSLPPVTTASGRVPVHEALRYGVAASLVAAAAADNGAGEGRGRVGAGAGATNSSNVVVGTSNAAGNLGLPVAAIKGTRVTLCELCRAARSHLIVLAMSSFMFGAIMPGVLPFAAAAYMPFPSPMATPGGGKAVHGLFGRPADVYGLASAIVATLVGVQLGRLLYRQRLLPWKGLYALIAVQLLAFAALLGTAVVASASSSLRHTGGDAVGIRLNRSLAASLLVVAALLCGLPYGYAVCHVFGDAVARRFQSVGSRYHTVFSVCSLAQGVRLASETGGAVLTLALVMSGCLVDTVAR